MSNSNDMMQMEARRRFMNQQMAAGRPPIPDSQHMEAQRFHQERPPAQQWQNNPPSDSTTMLPPMCFLRKEIMYKLINYRIDEEEGNKSRTAKYTFKKPILSSKRFIISNKVLL